MQSCLREKREGGGSSSVGMARERNRRDWIMRERERERGVWMKGARGYKGKPCAEVWSGASCSELLSLSLWMGMLRCCSSTCKTDTQRSIQPFISIIVDSYFNRAIDDSNFYYAFRFNLNRPYRDGRLNIPVDTALQWWCSVVKTASFYLIYIVCILVRM